MIEGFWGVSGNSHSRMSGVIMPCVVPWGSCSMNTKKFQVSTGCRILVWGLGPGQLRSGLLHCLQKAARRVGALSD